MKIGFIGCGNMGGALARAVARVDSFDLYLADNSEEKAEALANDTDGCVCDSATLASECDIIFLAVKPNIIATVAKEIKGPVCARKPLIVTMAAGVKIEALEAVFARTDVPIIRIMPNTVRQHRDILLVEGALTFLL